MLRLKVEQAVRHFARHLLGQIGPLIEHREQDTFDIDRVAKGVHRNHCPDHPTGGAIYALPVANFRAGLQILAQRVRVQPECALFAIHEMRRRAAVGNGTGRRDERQRRDKDFVISLHSCQ